MNKISSSESAYQIDSAQKTTNFVFLIMKETRRFNNLDSRVLKYDNRYIKVSAKPLSLEFGRSLKGNKIEN